MGLIESKGIRFVTWDVMWRPKKNREWYHLAYHDRFKYLAHWLTQNSKGKFWGADRGTPIFYTFSSFWSARDSTASTHDSTD